MDLLYEAVRKFFDLGAIVTLPVLIFLLGLFFRMKIAAAAKAGLFLGIGFQGLALVIDLLVASIAPATRHYLGREGGGFTTTDLGFATFGAASWSVWFAPFAVPLIVFANLALLRLRWTKVLNVDIWNFVHFLIPGSMAYALSGSFVLGLAVTVSLSIVSLFVADRIAPFWQNYFGLEGTTCSTFSFITLTYPVAWLLNRIIDAIPGLNRLDADFGKIGDKIRFFGDPAFLGLIVGVFLGFISSQSYGTMLIMGVGVSAVLILIPRMVGIMIEGLGPIGEAASAFMKKRLGDDADVNIGMDVSLALGDPACLTMTVITIPLTVLMALVIPGMTFFPIPILGIVGYTTALCVMASRGNQFRSLVTSLFSMLYILYFANLFVPEATEMLKVTGLRVEGMVTDGFIGFDPGCILVGLLNRLL